MLCELKKRLNAELAQLDSCVTQIGQRGKEATDADRAARGEQKVAPDSFRVVSCDPSEKELYKTIFAYGTEKNPSVPYPVCDEMYLN